LDSADAAAQATMAIWCVSSRSECNSSVIGERYSPNEGIWYYWTLDSWKESGSTSLTSGENAASVIIFECPEGWGTTVSSSVPEGYCKKDIPLPPCEPCTDSGQASAPAVGNPIDVTHGVKQETAVDYSNASGTLRFVRTYRSDARQWEHNYSTIAADLNESSTGAGCRWGQGIGQRGWHCFPYAKRGRANDVLLHRNGRPIFFGTSTDLSPAPDVNDRVTLRYDGSGQRNGLQVVNGRTDAIEIYDRDGHLISSTARSGLVTTYAYSDSTTPPEIAKKPGLLIAVTDHYGKSLQFAYDDAHHLIKMTDPEGQIFQYIYQAGILSKVIYPDGKQRIYLYGELENTSNITQPYALTGVIDENGGRYATFKYDDRGRAISTEHAGGVGKFTLSFPYYYQTNVTDPLGTMRRYSHAQWLGVYRNIGVSVPNEAGTGSDQTSIGYDENANLNFYRDFDWKDTSYTYDLTRNLETKRVEAVNSSAERIVSTEWHPTFRLPARIAEPKRITTYTYDGGGNELTRSVQATNDPNGARGFTATPIGAPQVATNTYDALGHLLTVDGPRTDVNDVTTYTYDTEGNLTRVTNALNQVTTFSNYDAHGRPGTITDPNGLATQFAYSSRGWLTSVTNGSETTSYEYDGVGQMTRATMHDGSYVSYSYDGAHRLTSITNNLGNSVIYTLDNAGNRVNEQTKDVNGVLARQISRVYNAQNRVQQITGAVQ
jgi:YD repeat-containing protein